LTLHDKSAGFIAKLITVSADKRPDLRIGKDGMSKIGIVPFISKGLPSRQCRFQ
jgi:hypothetical protein